MVILHFDLEYL